jgi:hypothetical protein
MRIVAGAIGDLLDEREHLPNEAGADHLALARMSSSCAS